MIVKYDDLKCCDECLVYIANGTSDLALCAMVAAQWPDEKDRYHMVLAGGPDDEGAFSWRSCDCCGSTDGGMRYAFVVLEEDHA